MILCCVFASIQLKRKQTNKKSPSEAYVTT